jgi:hypothetical protein
VTEYGTPAGLPERLQKWRDTLCTTRSLPWLGAGLIKDLEIAMQLLNMREFAEYVRDKGDPAHARFADEILQAQGILADAGHRSGTLADSVDALDDENRENVAKAVIFEEVRQVLVDTGCLQANDHETPVPDLVRMLLTL